MPTQKLQSKQSNTLAMVSFWSHFSVFFLNSILVLVLTKPLRQHGLGFSEAEAYGFFGITHAVGYLIPMLSGALADRVLGIRRTIMFGSVMMVFAFLLLTVSGLVTSAWSKTAFIAAYALIPVTNSLIMGTSAAMVSRIYRGDEIGAKSGMTLYYISINVGLLLATLLAPVLLDYRYGPLMIFITAFIGKAVCALNFAKHYRLYDNVATNSDSKTIDMKSSVIICTYLLSTYAFTLVAIYHPRIANTVISTLALMAILAFIHHSLKLEGLIKRRQLLAIVFIVEAVIFCVLYNQMNTTLVLFAKHHSDLKLLGLPLSPAHYQAINPITIIAMGMFLPKLYRRFPHFSIPYQFAAGTAVAGLSLLLIAYACKHAHFGQISGNVLAITYVLMSLAELWVSAIGMSMIGLYCDPKSVGYAMGMWYLTSAMGHLISGKVAQWVALPQSTEASIQSLYTFQHYYLNLGLVALMAGGLMWVLALQLKPRMSARNIVLH